jgi:rhodanese-related sulfurtransferase
MDRWWSDGSETGSRLWQGVATILATGCLLGIGQNALVRAGDPKDGLAWKYTPPKLDLLEDVSASGAAAPAAAADGAPGGASPLPPDMNDPLQIGAAAPTASGVPEIPDVPRPMQIQIAQVKAFFTAKAATIIDARDEGEYVVGHIPGAINLPYDQVITDPGRLEKFDAGGKPIIVYCGGGTCELSMNLGFALVNAGKKKVLVYMGGWPEWSTSGNPIAMGPTPEGA